MNTRKNNRLVLIALGVLLMLIALPSKWMTIHNGTIKSSVPGMEHMFQNQSVPISGLNGTVTLGPSIPTWLIVFSGITSLLLLFLNTMNVTSIPKMAVSIPFLFSAFYTVVAIVIGISSPQVSLGIGAFPVLLGVAIGVYVLLLKSAHVRPSDSSNELQPLRDFHSH